MQKRDWPVSTCFVELCQRVVQQLLMDPGSFLDKRPQFSQGFFPGPPSPTWNTVSPSPSSPRCVVPPASLSLGL